MAKELMNIAFMVTSLQLRIERYIFKVINKAKCPLIQGKEYPKPDQLYKDPNYLRHLLLVCRPVCDYPAIVEADYRELTILDDALKISLNFNHPYFKCAK